MTEPEEDFATMFEASIQAKRFERGQTIEGTIVAIGPEVAFVNVGGKGEALLEVDELKDADGVLEVAVGDRIQAMVVSNEGGLTPVPEAGPGSRQPAAARGRVPRRSSGGGQGRAGREGRLRGAHRRPERLLPDVPDRHRPDGGARSAPGSGLRVPDHRVQGGRQGPRRLAASSARGRAEGQCRRGPAVDSGRRGAERPRGLGPRVRRLRRPGGRSAGAAPRLRDGVVSRVGPVAAPVARPGDHRQGPARRRGRTEDRARAEAAQRRSVVDRSGVVRGGPGARRAASRASRSSAPSSSWRRGSRAWRTRPRSRRRGERTAGPSRSRRG